MSNFERKYRIDMPHADCGGIQEADIGISVYDAVRFAMAAPFSCAYRGRLRWLLDERKWEARGVAATDIRRKALIVPDSGAVYLAVSKAANTSLSFMLSTRRGVNERNVHKKRFAPQRLVDTGQTLSDLTDGSTPIFTFVRHPIARFWSAFSDKIVEARRKSRSRRWRRRRPEGPLAGLSTPEDLIDYIASTPAPQIEEHFRPQWSCTGIEHLPIAFVGKVETIDSDLEALVVRGLLTGAQAKRLPRFNSKRPSLLDKREGIDKILREIYRKDFELFGYS